MIENSISSTLPEHSMLIVEYGFYVSSLLYE